MSIFDVKNFVIENQEIVHKPQTQDQRHECEVIQEPKIKDQEPETTTKEQRPKGQAPANSECIWGLDAEKVPRGGDPMSILEIRDFLFKIKTSFTSPRLHTKATNAK